MLSNHKFEINLFVDFKSNKRKSILHYFLIDISFAFEEKASDSCLQIVHRHNNHIWKTFCLWKIEKEKNNCHIKTWNRTIKSLEWNKESTSRIIFTFPKRFRMLIDRIKTTTQCDDFLPTFWCYLLVVLNSQHENS